MLALKEAMKMQRRSLILISLMLNCLCAFSIAAQSSQGHPLLQKACVAAARHARFSPTLYEGKPEKVMGDIHYNFVVQ